MPPTGYTWAAFAVAGAGLVELGIAAGHWTNHRGWGVVLAGLGIAQVAWALLCLARARALTPADASLVTLQLVGALMLTMLVRRTRAQAAARAQAAPRPARHPGWSLVGWALGAVFAAALTTPGMATTGAGAKAAPNGTHDAGTSGPREPRAELPGPATRVPPAVDPPPVHTGH